MENIIVLGAAGFIGTNLAIALSGIENSNITLVDENMEYFNHISSLNLKGTVLKSAYFGSNTNFDSLLKNQDIVYHLVSSTNPTTSNIDIPKELEDNVIFSAKLLESCVRNNVKKVIFISSGGTVYGKEANCPLSEDTPTNPISSYGIQKVAIEKLLYLYNYMYGLDYRILRLSNPYGPYQRPNGKLGVVSTFTYKALCNHVIEVYGDGTVVRDFIYIDDVVRGILKTSDDGAKHHIYNLGSGIGLSVNDIIDAIKKVVHSEAKVEYKASRKVDVPVNYLDITRYEQEFGKLNTIDIEQGIDLMAEYMRKSYF